MPLFNKAEIAARLGEPKLQKLPRADLERMLADRAACGSEDIKAILRRNDIVYQRADDGYFTLYQLCFFGNLRQDLTDFVLRDLGLQRYENYSLDRANLPFRSRRQIGNHLAYYRCLEALDESLAQGAEAILTLWRALPQAEPSDPDPVLLRRVQRMTITLARQLERLEQTDWALILYSHCSRPPARERCARIRMARGDIDEALQLCSEMAARPINEEERIFGLEFGQRCARKHGRPWASLKKYQPPLLQLELAKNDLPVEEAVVRHLQANGACFYVENSLFNGVLGLLIWDIVFAAVPGAFYNPFQRAPADFYQPDFVTTRHTLLEQRLRDSRDSRVLAERVLSCWEQKQGLLNPLVNWDVLTRELLEVALQRIPNQHWQRLFRRLLEDLRYHRNGLPDLIAFPAAGAYQLLEVKGPGDKLQKNQLRWMQFFATADIPHQVVHVEWSAA